MQAVEAPSAVDQRFLSNPCLARSRTPFSHKPAALHRPFRPACGNRGKPGALLTPFLPTYPKLLICTARFWKTGPSLNPHCRHHFGHISTFPAATTGTTSSSITFLSFSYYPSHPCGAQPQHRPRHRSPLPQASSSRPPQGKKPGIQRSNPVFHAQPKPRVNTIKKKKRQQFPQTSHVLYSVASAESA